MDGLQYTFSGVIKQWLGSKSTWHYVPLPLTMSDEINTLRQYHQSKRRGWGAVKVEATIGALAWQTSIFPAFDQGCYALFLKADIRKQAALRVDDTVTLQLTLLI